MTYTVQIFLFLLLLGLTLAGCYSKLSKAKAERYTGTQTVNALMQAFDARYSKHNKQMTTSGGITRQGEERNITFGLADMDTRYPREEWLQLLLDNGMRIENYETYSKYLNGRSELILEEFHNETEWERVKASHVEDLLEKYRLVTEAAQAVPEIDEWIVIGEKALPKIPGRIYVQQKTGSRTSISHTISSTTTSENGEVTSVKGPELTEEQKRDLLDNGVVPKGWEVVYVDEKGNRISENR